MGLYNRAVCYRRLGDVANAEKDEFRIMKSQQERHLGIRHSRRKVDRTTRLYSDEDIERYNQLVVADQEESAAIKYDNEYRGKVQNLQVSVDLQPDAKIDSTLLSKPEAELHSWERAVVLFNRANSLSASKEYQQAIELYNEALLLDEGLADAYYNRGLTKIFDNRIDEGIRDLSIAGERGIYRAYSVIKKYRK